MRHLIEAEAALSDLDCAMLATPREVRRNQVACYDPVEGILKLKDTFKVNKCMA